MKPKRGYWGILERDFQAEVVKAARTLGWLCYDTWNSQHSPKGWVDLVLIRGDRCLFRELKGIDIHGNRGDTTDEQDECIAALTIAGQDADVWYPDSPWLEELA